MLTSIVVYFNDEQINFVKDIAAKAGSQTFVEAPFCTSLFDLKTALKYFKDINKHLRSSLSRDAFKIFLVSYSSDEFLVGIQFFMNGRDYNKHIDFEERNSRLITKLRDIHNIYRISKELTSD